MKKTYWISSLVLAHLALTTAVASHDRFTGFSVTGALGGIMGSTHVSQFAAINTWDQGDLPTQESMIYDLTLSDSNIVGAVAGEYDYQFQYGFLLGVAVVIGFENLEISNTEYNATLQTFEFTPPDVGHGTTALDSTFKTRLKNDFALLFKPGYVFRDRTLVYALIGPRWGNFESSVESTGHTYGKAYVGSPIYDVVTYDDVFSGKESTSGYQLGVTAGVGVQQALTDHFRLGIEYAYTHYANLESIDIYAVQQLYDTTPFIKVAGSVGPYDVSTNAVMGTLSYKF
jgi:opacity protein-like surface antigen